MGDAQNRRVCALPRLRGHAPPRHDVDGLGVLLGPCAFLGLVIPVCMVYYGDKLVASAPGGESDVRVKGRLFMLFFGLAYSIGAVMLFVIFLIVYFVTMSVTHVDIGVWLVLWFLLTQAWGVALA